MSMKKKIDIKYNKNEDNMKLLVSEMKQKKHIIKLGGGEVKIEKQHKKGKFVPSYATFKVVLHGLPFDVGHIEIDKEVISKDQFNSEENFINVDHNFEEIHVFKMR